MRRAVPLFALLGAAAAITACDETLEGGLGCGVLCPQKPSAIQQDTLFAVDLDTSLGGYPATGAEGLLLLSHRGDTLDARAIVRFDTLPAVYRPLNSVDDIPIAEVDSATLSVVLANTDTLGPVVTFEAYDVDGTAGDDTTAAVLAPRFEPSRLLGSVVYDPALKNDTVRIPIDSARLLAKIQQDSAPRRLRVGLRITAAQSAEVLVVSFNSGFGAVLQFRPSPDSGVAAITLLPSSRTPDAPHVAADLADFQLVAVAPPPPPPNVLRIGGVPGARGYIRFNVPARIVDSSVIVRAELQLTQSPNRSGPAAADTGAVAPFIIAAGGVLTDLRRALLFLAAGFDSTRLVPADSGIRSFEILPIMRSWRGTTAERTPRALALRASTEGTKPWQADFFSNEAPAAVRPRLVITYVPQPAPRVP